jgi:hypothetical protein
VLKKIPHRTTCTLHPSWSSNSLGSPVNIREHGTTLRTTWKERPYHIILLHLCPYWSVSDSGFISCVNKWYFLFHWTLILDIYKAESRFFKSVFMCYNVVESVFICFDVFPFGVYLLWVLNDRESKEILHPSISCWPRKQNTIQSGLFHLQNHWEPKKRKKSTKISWHRETNFKSILLNRQI